MAVGERELFEFEIEARGFHPDIEWLYIYWGGKY